MDIHYLFYVFVRIRMPPKPEGIILFTGRPISLVEGDVSNPSVKVAKTGCSSLDRQLAVSLVD